MSEGIQVVPAVAACVRSPLLKHGGARRGQIAQNTSRNALWRAKRHECLQIQSTNSFLEITQRRDQCVGFG